MAVVNQLLFERTPDAFHGSVVEAIPLAAHRRHQLETIKYLLIFIGTVLAAAVRVMNQPTGRALGVDRPKQRLAHQVPGQAVSHRVAYDLRSKEVLVTAGIATPRLSAHRFLARKIDGSQFSDASV